MRRNYLFVVLLAGFGIDLNQWPAAIQTAALMT